jgi:hypothetical protein
MGWLVSAPLPAPENVPTESEPNAFRIFLSFSSEGLLCSPSGIPLRRFLFRSRRGETLPSSGRGYSGYGFPNRVYFAGTSRLPKFLGNPHVHMPCSTTAVDLRTRPYFGLSGFAFRSWNDVGFHNSLFEAQSHGLRTPCLRFAATVTRWLAQNSVPTAGQLCRTGLFTCWVPLQSFSYYTSSLSKFLGALHDGSRRVED